MAESAETFFQTWSRVIKQMSTRPKFCPRCGLMGEEAAGMECCNFARSYIGGERAQEDGK